MAQLSIDRAIDLAQRALRKAGAGEAMANATARALVLADAQSLSGHGLSRVPQYSTHLRNGRADGQAVASVLRRKGAAVLVDAQQGLAFPACELAITEAIATARAQGAAAMAKWNALRTTGLAALNASRRTAGQPVITIPDAAAK